MRCTLILILIIAAASLVVSQSVASKASKSVAHEGYFIGADGVRLSYRKIERGKKLIVLLHGGPGSNMNAVWLDLEPLARNRP